MILWWVANALLVLALPVVLAEASKIMRSLATTRAAARDIAASLRSVSATAPPTMTTLSAVAELCRRLEREEVPCPSPV